MSLEVLDSIREAEKKAEEKRLDAQHQAREIAKSVEAACAAQLRSAAVDNRTLYQKILDEKRAEVSQSLEKAKTTYAQERAVLAEKAGKNLDAAASRIYERVMSNGHS